MHRKFIHVLIFLGLTVVTQIGGVVYLLAVLIGRRLALGKITIVGLFIGAYVASSIASNAIAPIFGRTALPCFVGAESKMAMQSPLLCILNRHYVRSELKKIVLDMATYMDTKFPDTVTLALDGNFPFFDGFPLLPHLSHTDGRKLDIAFYYQRGNSGYVKGQTRSPFGYWAYETPNAGVELPCAGRNDILTMRWDVKWLGPFLRDFQLNAERSRAALLWLGNEGAQRGLSKVFVEPHLLKRFNVTGDVFRFQGCRAARHDDHIHIQIR